ncbi:MAG: glycoside hydrolase family 3 N-terminal domain-containing protein [Acutalibacteraceae bacterium]|jgi:beta-glucosidase
MTKQELINLLNDMSLDEKIGEITQLPGRYFVADVEATGESEDQQISERDMALCGSTLSICKPDLIYKIQKKHIENHPHKIPMLFMADIIHGYSTIFPIPLAQGCSFDPELVEEISRLTAKETAPSGLHITFSPMVDLVRDPRWGRVMESYGEDTYLNCLMAAAAVRGYQGEGLDKEDTIGACVKHFAAYGAVEGGREYGVVDISERSLYQDYLPSYKAACDAGSAMLMSAFNAIGGDPCSGSRKLLLDILRNEWKWEGAVISDWSSVHLMKSHGISKDDADLAELAINCRLAIEMCSYCYKNGIKKLLDQKRITIKQLDRIVLDVLTLKNKLGLFENPYRFCDAEKLKAAVNTEETRQAAKNAVTKTSVLLKNEGILPLDKKGQKIAFIGPYIDNPEFLGAWTIGGVDRPKAETIKSVLNRRFENSDFSFASGCGIYGIEQLREAEFYFIADEIDDKEREAHISQAVSTAENADTVVLFLGEHVKPGGELASKAFLTLPDIQLELLRRVHAVNPNIVVVLFNHRPLELLEVSNKAKAILDVWFPGTMGAEAIVDMLFGDAAPSGRLSMSFPYTVGQVPIYYNQLPTDHSIEYQTRYATGYIDCPNQPLYAFGEGLTYTEFTYGELNLSKTEISSDETLTAEIEVTNIGERDGVEVVQLYLRDMEASVSRPLKELKGVKRVYISRGETVKVSFEINADMLRIYDINMNYVFEPGEFRVFIGHDSRVSEFKTFKLK